jgi:peptidoglycan/LPS O-acetylase OafA/YrhL
VLTPKELAGAAGPFLGLLAGVLALGAVMAWRGPQGWSVSATWHLAARNVAALAGTFLAGTVLTPLLLPWVPGRAFALKGWLVGLLAVGAAAAGWPGDAAATVATLLIWPPLTAFLALNFTGCSTYTGPSGVRAEMRVAVPAMVASTALGLVLAGLRAGGVL